jgi:hypothetical protein
VTLVRSNTCKREYGGLEKNLMRSELKYMNRANNKITWILLSVLLVLVILIVLQITFLPAEGKGSGGSQAIPNYCCYVHPSQPEEPPSEHPIPRP